MFPAEAWAMRAVYLLRSLSEPRRVYIGFSADPRRRLQQHNQGSRRGGARRTSGRGPWEMQLFVHGFPSDVAALRFEWAWQHPSSTPYLPAPPTRRRGEQPISFALRLLPRLLLAPPWSRLPLRIRWLRPRPALELAPPTHMTEEEGAELPRVKRRRGCGLVATPTMGCGLCGEAQATPLLRCPRPRCPLAAHPPCLARKFLEAEPEQLLPLGGACPGCHAHLLWGDLIRHHLGEAEPEDSDDVTPPSSAPL